MKKVLFALAAVVALAACSKEETIIADKGTAIGFDTFVENSTRATDPSLTTDSMQEDGFGVYGFVTNNNVTAPLFTNEHIYWDDTNDVWTYGTKQYWIAGATYDFAAIAPYGSYTVTDVDTDGVNLTFTSNGTTDLLYAQNNDILGPAGTVGFTFKHLLSKVKFTFTNNYDATNTAIAVKNIVINDAYSVGAAELGLSNSAVTATWAPSSANLDLAFGNANPDAGYIAYGASQDSDKALLLIPTAGHTYNVTFTIDLLYKNGDDYVVVTSYNHTVALTHNFEFGKSYNVATTIDYTNIVPDGPGGEDNEQSTIEFTVTDITDWVDGGNAGVVFPENN